MSTYQTINQEDEALLDDKSHKNRRIWHNLGYLAVGLILGIILYHLFSSNQFNVQSDVDFSKNNVNIQSYATGDIYDSLNDTLTISGWDNVAIRVIFGGYYCASRTGTSEVVIYTVFYGDYCTWVVIAGTSGYYFRNRQNGEYLDASGTYAATSTSGSQFKTDVTFTAPMDNFTANEFRLRYVKLYSTSIRCFYPSEYRCIDNYFDAPFVCLVDMILAARGACSFTNAGVRFEIF